MLVLAAAALMVGAGGWARQRVVTARLQRRLAAHRVVPDTADTGWWDRAGERVAPLAAWLEGRAARVIAQLPRLTAFGSMVEETGVGVGASEVVAAGVVVGGATAIAMAALGLPVGMALVLGAVAACAPAAVVAVIASRRRTAFATELPDVLVLLAGTLRAGVPLTAALEAAAREAGGPVAPELRRVAGETALGRPLPEALAAVAQRMRSEEVAWVGMAVEIHQDAGGNLAEILDTVARTVVEGQRLRREVSALTAEGRISAIVLGILPIGLAGVIAVVNPGYLSSLLETRVGTTLVIASGVGMVVGFAWMRRIVNVEV